MAARLKLAEMRRDHAVEALALIRKERSRRAGLKARTSLIEFCRWVLPGFIAGRFHRHLCAELERVSAKVAAGEVARVLLEVPPQHGKTWILTAWMVWHAAIYGGPIAYGTYSDERSNTVSRHAQEIARGAAEEWKRELHRDTKQTQTVTEWHARRGSFRFVGRGGQLTGSPAQVLVVDDPYKNKAEGDSPAIRREVEGWYCATTQTRLTKAHAVVILHTRWHDEDLIGTRRREMEAGKGWPWTVISYPAIATEHDDLGREPGDALFPELKPRGWLDKMRETVGEIVWAALFQQSPTVEGGLVFKRSDFSTRYEHDPQRPPMPYARVILSIDCNFKEGKDNDASAAVVLGETQDGRYLDALAAPFNDPMAYPDLELATCNAILAHRPTEVLVEEKANGAALIATLRKTVAEFCKKHGIRVPAVVAWNPKASKEARAAVASSHWRAGACRLPLHAPWVEAWITQHLGFGAGAAHDDLVDAGSQAVIYMREPEQEYDPLERARKMMGAFG